MDFRQPYSNVCRSEWNEDGQLWVQYVSTTPATRLDVINLQEELDRKLQQRQVHILFLLLFVIFSLDRCNVLRCFVLPFTTLEMFLHLASNGFRPVKPEFAQFEKSCILRPLTS